MKLTKTIVKQFEEEQERFGTNMAISNLIWNLAVELLRDIKVENVSTTYWDEKKPKKGKLSKLKNK